jgi:hypothetical protein
MGKTHLEERFGWVVILGVGVLSQVGLELGPEGDRPLGSGSWEKGHLNYALTITRPKN